MLFFYWMSAKGGSSMLYHNVISRVLKRSIQSDSATRLDSTTGCVDGMIVSDDVDKNREMMEEELDDSILESVQKSENDECTFSDQDSNIDDGDSISSDKGTLENLEADVDIVSHESKSFQSEVMFTMSAIKVTSLDKASEAAE
jgi:transcription antitermination factor NusG